MSDERETAYPDSGQWYRTRTDVELQAQVDGNMPGGRAHDNAMAELEKRRRDRDQQKQFRWIQWTFWASVAAIAATFLT